MDKFQSNASDRSRNEQPENARFTSQAATAEDLLKAQTVGLVNLSDYRKRRAEALDLKERGLSSTTDSGASTPTEEYEFWYCTTSRTLICKVQSIYTQASV
jgi:protein FAM50